MKGSISQLNKSGLLLGFASAALLSILGATASSAQVVVVHEEVRAFNRPKGSVNVFQLPPSESQFGIGRTGLAIAVAAGPSPGGYDAHFGLRSRRGLGQFSVTVYFKSGVNHSSGNGHSTVLFGTAEITAKTGRRFERTVQKFSELVPDGGGWQWVTMKANFPSDLKEEPAEVRVQTVLQNGSVTFGKIELNSSNGIVFESQPVIVLH